MSICTATGSPARRRAGKVRHMTKPRTAAPTDVLLLREGDDVAVATRPLAPGDQVVVGDDRISVLDTVPRGHKIALRAVPARAGVHKYGQVIGVATTDIAPGEHVHTHNLGFEDGERAHELGGSHV